MQGVTILETRRLQLRPWQPEDIDDYARIFGKAPAMAFQMDRGLSRTEAVRFLEFHLEGWRQHPSFGHWAVIVKYEQRPIGWVGLEPTSSFPGAPAGIQIGWRLDPDCWGQGYTTEGALAVLGYGFNELALPEIYVLFHPGNRASARVAEKLGARPLTVLASSEGEQHREVYVLARETFLSTSRATSPCSPPE